MSQAVDKELVDPLLLVSTTCRCPATYKARARTGPSTLPNSQYPLCFCGGETRAAPVLCTFFCRGQLRSRAAENRSAARIQNCGFPAAVCCGRSQHSPMLPRLPEISLYQRPLSSKLSNRSKTTDLGSCGTSTFWICVRLLRSSSNAAPRACGEQLRRRALGRASPPREIYGLAQDVRPLARLCTFFRQVQVQKMLLFAMWSRA